VCALPGSKQQQRTCSWCAACGVRVRKQQKYKQSRGKGSGDLRMRERHPRSGSWAPRRGAELVRKEVAEQAPESWRPCSQTRTDVKQQGGGDARIRQGIGERRKELTGRLLAEDEEGQHVSAELCLQSFRTVRRTLSYLYLADGKLRVYL
jgi:hypothetical protein